MSTTQPSCEGCWAVVEASDAVVLASNPVHARDMATGELRILERGPYAYFHVQCWRDDQTAGWVEQRRGTYADVARGSA